MALGENCRSGCRTRDHASWGECARSARLRVGWAASATGGMDKTSDKKFNNELDLYARARADGLQPASTKPESVHEAYRVSEMTGTAYNSEIHPPTGLLPDKRTATAAQEVGYL